MLQDVKSKPVRRRSLGNTSIAMNVTNAHARTYVAWINVTDPNME